MRDYITKLIGEQLNRDNKINKAKIGIFSMQELEHKAQDPIPCIMKATKIIIKLKIST